MLVFNFYKFTITGNTNKFEFLKLIANFYLFR